MHFQQTFVAQLQKLQSMTASAQSETTLESTLVTDCFSSQLVTFSTPVFGSLAPSTSQINAVIIQRDSPSFQLTRSETPVLTGL